MKVLFWRVKFDMSESRFFYKREKTGAKIDNLQKMSIPASQMFVTLTVVLMDIESGKVLLDITFDRCVLAVRFTSDK